MQKNIVAYLFSRLAPYLIIAIIVMLLIFIFDKIHTVYNITATTEIIECYSNQKPNSRINLFDADIYTLEKKEEGGWELHESLLAKSFKGTLELGDSTNIKLERIAHGALLIEIERASSGTAAILRSNSSKDLKHKAIPDILFIEINNVDSILNSNTSVVIPLSGKIDLGKSIEIESENEYSLLLKEGDITMTGYTSIGNSSFPAGSEKLYLGDKLVFNDENSIGIASLNTGPAIQVSYRAIGDEARVIKPGPKNQEDGYRFSASIFSRFQHDKPFQAFSIILGITLYFITVADFYITLKEKKEPK